MGGVFSGVSGSGGAIVAVCRSLLPDEDSSVVPLSSFDGG